MNRRTIDFQILIIAVFCFLFATLHQRANSNELTSSSLPQLSTMQVYKPGSVLINKLDQQCIAIDNCYIETNDTIIFVNKTIIASKDSICVVQCDNQRLIDRD